MEINKFGIKDISHGNGEFIYDHFPQNPWDMNPVPRRVTLPMYNTEAISSDDKNKKINLYEFMNYEFVHVVNDLEICRYKQYIKINVAGFDITQIETFTDKDDFAVILSKENTAQKYLFSVSGYNVEKVLYKLGMLYVPLSKKEKQNYNIEEI